MNYTHGCPKNLIILILLLSPGIVFAQYPTTFDLRDYDGVCYVTSVKDQQGGTCWTHGAMAAIESNLIFTGNWTAAGDTGEPNLAEYHLDWWNGFNEFNNDDTDPPTGGGLEVHYGGDYLVTAGYLTRGEGAVRDIDGQSFESPPLRTDTSYHYYYVNDIEWFEAGMNLENIETIKNILMTRGAVGTAFCVSGQFDDTNGNHYQPIDAEDDPNHAVAIIGWDDTLSIGPIWLDDAVPPGPGGWLVKNSWGEGNWDFFYISYYDKHCGQHPEMGAVSLYNAELMPYDRVYYHDYHGWRDTKTDCARALNAFKTSLTASGELITAVSFFTAEDNVDFTFKIYDIFENGLLSEELVSQSGSIDYRGFHTISLDYPPSISPGDDFYVYLDLSTGGQAYDRTSEVPVLLGAKYRATVESTSDTGQSYYWDGSSWLDLYDFDSTANFCIKALTNILFPLNIEFPDGLPESLIPDTPTMITVRIEDADENYIPGTGMLHYRYDGGEYNVAELTAAGDNLYEAVLPPADCDDIPEYYFSAMSDGENIVVDPVGAPAVCHHSYVGINVPILDDNFETDVGWVVSGNASDGFWERGVPTGGGAAGDPASDFDGSGQCYLTGNWMDDSDVDDGYCYLISPTLDLSNSYMAIIEFGLWYTNNTVGGEQNNDIFRIYFSNNDGSSWVLVDSAGPVTSKGWMAKTYHVNEFIIPTHQFKIRFEVSDLGAESVVEAAVDAVNIFKYLCAPELQIVEEDLPDWTALIPFSYQIQSTGGYYPIVWSDKFNDLEGTGLELSGSGLLSGLPASSGVINFTAVATDDSLNTVEKQFDFIINPPLGILAEDLPVGNPDMEYSYQMSASGGTGEKAWADLNNGLEGSGLSLSSDGLISGIPVDTGIITFIACVDDAVGAHDELECSITVEIAFVCGDANGDGTVNILDITYLINYLYKGGAAPTPLEAGNTNGDEEINILDITYLISYLYKEGPEPICP